MPNHIRSGAALPFSPASVAPLGPTTPAPLVRLPFRDGELLAVDGPVDDEGDRLIPLRPFCDRLGVGLSSQLAKLRGKPWACVVMISTQIPGDDQARAVACLPLRALPAWLMTISASKVSPEARPMLVAFQLEAAWVLHKYFLGRPLSPTWTAEGGPGTASSTVRSAANVRVASTPPTRTAEGAPEPLISGLRMPEQLARESIEWLEAELQAAVGPSAESKPTILAITTLLRACATTVDSAVTMARTARGGVHDVASGDSSRATGSAPAGDAFLGVDEAARTVRALDQIREEFSRVVWGLGIPGAVEPAAAPGGLPETLEALARDVGRLVQRLGLDLRPGEFPTTKAFPDLSRRSRAAMAMRCWLAECARPLSVDELRDIPREKRGVTADELARSYARWVAQHNGSPLESTEIGLWMKDPALGVRHCGGSGRPRRYAIELRNLEPDGKPLPMDWRDYLKQSPDPWEDPPKEKLIPVSPRGRR